MTAITINERTIAKLEEKGFSRWTKNGMDRMYINATELGLTYSTYKSGNISSATWQGEKTSNANAHRLLSSKIYIDLADGELHVNTNFRCYDAELVDVAAAYVESIASEIAEEEKEEEKEEEIEMTESATTSGQVANYTAPFMMTIDEEICIEQIDREWMTETAPSEYASSKDEYSNYLGCTQKEAILRGIHSRALVWFAAKGSEAERRTESYGTDYEPFDTDLKNFFASVQANFYCKALQNGMSGKQALEFASEALTMVAEPYRDHMAEWNEDIEG